MTIQTDYKQIDIDKACMQDKGKSSLKRRFEEAGDKAAIAKEAMRWYWWDYHFQLEMIDKQLEICEKHWGVDTHYVGDGFTKGRIVVVRSYYKMYKEAESWENEYKYLRKFVQAYARLLPRLWD